jgi:predicted transposase
MKKLALTAKVKLIVSDSDMQLLLDTVRTYTAACNVYLNGSFTRVN